MKRLLGTILATCVAVGAIAQAPFTIVRPSDGSRVRENVHVLIPKNSVPASGYVGIFLGGKFIEATTPPVDKTGKFYDYTLDTKARGIPDGKLSLEAVLYVDYESQPRIIDRSTVEVTVANSAASKIPADGIYLRYKWTPGTEAIYDVSVRNIEEFGDASKNSLGARAAQQTQDVLKVRLAYAVDNAYGNGDGLVRIQALPEKGQDSAFFITSLDPTGKRYYANEMAPVYMRLTGTGLQVFGAVPFATPLEGTQGEQQETNLFADLPLPTLPAKKVKPGSFWSSRFQEGTLDLANLYTQSNLVEHFPARGDFKDVEWEMGHPCAKITNEIEVAQPSVEQEKLKKAGRAFTGNREKVEETIWFALDRKQVIKIVRRTTREAAVQVQNGYGPGGTGNGSPAFGPGGTGPGGSKRGMPGGAGGREDDLNNPIDLNQMGAPGMPGSYGPGGSGPGGQAGYQRGSGRGQRGGTGTPASAAFVRTTQEFTFILEL